MCSITVQIGYTPPTCQLSVIQLVLRTGCIKYLADSWLECNLYLPPALAHKGQSNHSVCLAVHVYVGLCAQKFVLVK